MKYRDLVREHRSMQDLEGVFYDTAAQAFRVRLQHALRDDDFMLGLSRSQLLQFLSWCSCYRPHEPYVILTYFSLLWEKVDERRTRSAPA